MNLFYYHRIKSSYIVNKQHNIARERIPCFPGKSIVLPSVTVFQGGWEKVGQKTRWNEEVCRRTINFYQFL